ncbi:MAG: hypothetical protein R2711_01510 [Acidimicrobiales bacterium]
MRVAVANDYDLIVAGVADLLRDFADDIVVCDRLILGDPVSGDRSTSCSTTPTAAPAPPPRRCGPHRARRGGPRRRVFSLDVTSRSWPTPRRPAHPA